MGYHEDWPRYRIEGQEIRREISLKMLEKLGFKNYVRRYGTQNAALLSIKTLHNGFKG
jgi:hypothetical protein